jgi:hypothetical protein
MGVRHDTEDERDSDMPPNGSPGRPFIRISKDRRAVSLAEKNDRWATDQSLIDGWQAIPPVLPRDATGAPELFAQPAGDRACVGYAVAAALRCHRLRNDNLDPGPLNPYFLYGAALSRAEDRAAKLVGPGGPPRPAIAKHKEGAAPLPGLPAPAPVIPSVEDALVVANEYGTPLLAQQPNAKFASAPREKRDVTPYLANARHNRLRSWVHLGAWQYDWYRWLLKVGPIVVHMNVEEDAFKAAKGGFISYRYPSRGDKGAKYAGHAAVIVGYDPTPVDPAQAEQVPSKGKSGRAAPRGFVLLNSYGSAWGEQGLGFISPRVAQQCFVAGYGLLSGAQWERFA